MIGRQFIPNKWVWCSTRVIKIAFSIRLWVVQATFVLVITKNPDVWVVVDGIGTVLHDYVDMSSWWNLPYWRNKTRFVINRMCVTVDPCTATIFTICCASHCYSQISWTDDDNISRVYSCLVSDLWQCLLLSWPDIHQMSSHWQLKRLQSKVKLNMVHLS